MKTAIIKVRGGPDAQAIADVLHGREVAWEYRGGGWHQIAFNWDRTADNARRYLCELFPNATISKHVEVH